MSMRGLAKLSAAPGVRRSCLGTVLHRQAPNWRHTVKAHGLYSRYNDSMAERETEYLYDDDPMPAEEEAEENEEGVSSAGSGWPAGTQKLLLAVAQRMYTTPWLPNSYIGPVALQRIKGKGWGLVASDHVPAGELLLVCLPLAHASSATAEVPPASALMERLTKGRYSFAARQAFEALFDGTSSRNRPTVDGTSSSSSRDGRGGTGSRRQPDLAEFVEASARGRPKPGRLGSKLPLQLPEDRLQRIIALNAFGCHCQDQAVAACRREQLAGVLGIWPGHALINHSCLPNASAVIVGGAVSNPTASGSGAGGGACGSDLSSNGTGNGVGGGGDAAAALPRLLLRAARDLVPGEEVCVSYLGQDTLAPLEARREELLGSYGFACRCPRCRAEASLGDGLAELLHDAYLIAPGLREQALQALEAGDTAALRALDAQVTSLVSRLDRAIAEAGIVPALATWVRGGAIELYALSAACRMELEPQAYRSLKSLALVLELTGALLPGSDLHTLLAARFYGIVAAKYGSANSRTLEALQLCRQAHKLRYGPLDLSTLRTLMDASAAVATATGDGSGTQLLPPCTATAAAAASSSGASSGGSVAGTAGVAEGDAVDVLMQETLEQLAQLSGGEVLSEGDPRALELLQQEAAAAARQDQETMEQQEGRRQQKQEALAQQQARSVLLQAQLQQRGAPARQAADAGAAARSDDGASTSSRDDGGGASTNGSSNVSTNGISNSSSNGSSNGSSTHGTSSSTGPAGWQASGEPSSSAAAAATQPTQQAAGFQAAPDMPPAQGSGNESAGASAAAIAAAALRRARDKRRSAAAARSKTPATSGVAPRTVFAHAADLEAPEAANASGSEDAGDAPNVPEAMSGEPAGLAPSQYSNLLSWMQHKDAAAAAATARAERHGRQRRRVSGQAG